MPTAGVAPRKPAACPECGGRVSTSQQETVCTDCGLVVDDLPIDHGPEWRSFGDDQTNPERTGAPLTDTVHDRGLSTEIGRKHDANGNQLSGQKRSHMARLRREHKRAQFKSHQERNLADGFTEIRRIVAAVGLGSAVRKQACSLFRTATEGYLLMGRSIEAMAAAAVYATCRCTGQVCTMDELVPVAQVNRDRVVNAYHVLNVELGLPAKILQPTDFVPQLADRIDAPDRVKRRALHLARAVEDACDLSGHKPSGVAAACLYRAGQERGWMETQERIADEANVSPPTMRAWFEDLDDVAEGVE